MQGIPQICKHLLLQLLVLLLLFSQKPCTNKSLLREYTDGGKYPFKRRKDISNVSQGSNICAPLPATGSHWQQLRLPQPFHGLQGSSALASDIPGWKPVTMVSVSMGEGAKISRLCLQSGIMRMSHKTFKTFALLLIKTKLDIQDDLCPCRIIVSYS